MMLKHVGALMTPSSLTQKATGRFRRRRCFSATMVFRFAEITLIATISVGHGPALRIQQAWPDFRWPDVAM
jgi:hypothetical protein